MKGRIIIYICNCKLKQQWEVTLIYWEEKNKILTITNAGEDVEQQACSPTAYENARCNSLEDSLAILYKIKQSITQQRCSSDLTKQIENYVYTKTWI